jgi:hypothetical protein
LHQFQIKTDDAILNNKDYMVQNLILLFSNVPEVEIDKFESLKSWIQEVSHAPYWN